MKRFRFLPKLPRLIIGFAFCCSLLLLLRGFTHSNDLAFLYDLPKKDMVLHLEESISSSVSTSMDHTVSSHQWGLSGITAVGTLHLDPSAGLLRHRSPLVRRCEGPLPLRGWHLPSLDDR